ncbi:uncharacterized protein L3040_000099 [Drepanopeziza brunnea f. sp. 'multigermtubi']|uniref:DNA (cytosine-5-)-methyltransferase n=1 Tax=Marssonina brunnea f. sp. multigermtubi (strain MB_m1) TaxID=1072389 RepID=K1WQC6_MARBU|nr:C-5 cytosine-specific DNA methylase [Drepanopeziza brunnea f. sp. 'multigermtubi' MB_m1]EKD14577.1 C-5 cytosine-specific DNA methylase [Drepanopeziza brunnea f. sp. 'multigermtubi' MB_m1]KAJ5053808.1 hypothetical protein L3040_000099 [Drepanopeziza brunnea f. sp. 'multigermtubi']
MAPFTDQEVVVLDDEEEIIIIDDDDDDEDDEGDIEIIDFMPPPTGLSPEDRFIGIRPYIPSTPSIASVISHPRSTSQGTQLGGSCSPGTTRSRINSTFRRPNWGFNVSKSLSASRSSLGSCFQHRSESLGDPRSFVGCPSPRSGPGLFSGTAQEPIPLDDEEAVSEVTPRRISRAFEWRSRAVSLSSAPVARPGIPSSSNFAILDDADPLGLVPVGDRLLSQEPGPEQAPTHFKPGEIIDLEEDVVEMLRVEDAYEEEEKRRRVRRKVEKVVHYERRNPTIVGAWQRIESTICLESITLKANKTVQLKDESFIRIKDILRNSETEEIRIRGHRLQRARDLNGLLQKKLNELVVFLEVDLDDPRAPLEQSTVEVSLEEVARVRSVRFTNQKFPLARNVVLTEFRDKEHAAEDGGLTVRWTYTCTYESAGDRDHNVFKERSLERLKVDECTPGFEISDEDARTLWRGETIIGGSYRPGIDPEEVIEVPDSPSEVPIDVAGMQEPEAVLCIPNQSIDIDEHDQQTSELVPEGPEGVQGSREKRNHSAVDLEPADVPTSGSALKRIRCQDLDEVEETREGVARMSLQTTEPEMPIDLEAQPELADDQPLAPETIDLSIELPKMIDLVSSDPTPPEPDTPRPPPEPKPPVNRTAGQTYTYGDAFCGGGGSSRGATMAGLRLRWGFDFNKHACLTWRTNFPFAHCHELPAHEFVDLSKTDSNPDAMKVDILHLSPPCQFFSPAHTIEGTDDEMNTASLFAVQEVIEVARARIVTLEQTFGIACSRFRFYFNALIQMFTTHDFSVRWAIVPLAQWGLPQRRQRLIIIASCPGEPLPLMPPPTHSATGPIPPLNLPPFVSANITLASIPYNASDHDIRSVIWDPERYQTPWDGTKILPRAMTTSGGQNYHPSGKRDLTLREYASLQGFPPKHCFRGTYVKKQIGNAVPPVVAKVLFGHLKGSLEREDGVEGPELIE